MKIDYVEACNQNYIWLLHTPAGGLIAVDPGDAEPVNDYLEREDRALTAILNTHRHWDHVDGIAPLAARWGCPVYGPAREPAPVQDHALYEGVDIVVEGLRFRILDIPGHTAGHIAYVGEGIALVGDTLFAGGCGRLFEGTPEQMFRSLGKLAALPPATKIYCAHEYTVANLAFARLVDPENADIVSRIAHTSAQRERREPTVPSTLSDELATNPFLRCETPAIQVAAAKHAGVPLRNAVDVFATVRLWKDTTG
ncbi:MAG: hydroxyacylglutathione hydrolase [Gammaproteobacteria bacterium]